MKKIILLFVFAICASLSYGQFKVESDGSNHALNNILQIGEQAGANPAIIQVGLERTAAGSSQFDFYTTATTNVTDYQLRLSSLATGQSAFRHKGTAPFNFRTDNNVPIRFQTNGNTERMSIEGNGDVVIRGVASVSGGVTTFSDDRLKKNVSGFNYGLEEVLRINPVYYSYTGEAGTSTKRPFVGVIAQELQKIAPELVSDRLVNQYDADGNMTSSESYLTVHDTELKFMLVNAIQDQQKLIEEQNAKLAELEGMIGASEGGLNRTSVVLSNYDLAELEQNTPNPFNGFTNVKYVVPTDANDASMKIFGSNGQLLKTVQIDHVGEGELSIDAQDLSSGTYSYQLIVDGRVIESMKMVVTK